VHCVSPGYIKTNLSLSALKGDGKTYGKMDKTTMNGADPLDVAKHILHHVDEGTFSCIFLLRRHIDKPFSIIRNYHPLFIGKTDFIVAAGLAAKVAIVLKFFAPRLLEKLLVKRFKKAEKEQKS